MNNRELAEAIGAAVYEMPRVEFDEDVGLFGVWLDSADCELIGAGDSEAEALEDALRTVMSWGKP